MVVLVLALVLVLGLEEGTWWGVWFLCFRVMAAVCVVSISSRMLAWAYVGQYWHVCMSAHAILGDVC